MDQRTMEKIFDPFFTTKDLDEGTGMGLAVVDGIIKGHQGGINVTSRPGQGSTFEVLLPLAEEKGAWG
jgi:signal transduction histidine kinase